MGRRVEACPAHRSRKSNSQSTPLPLGGDQAAGVAAPAYPARLRCVLEFDGFTPPGEGENRRMNAQSAGQGLCALDAEPHFAAFDCGNC